MHTFFNSPAVDEILTQFLELLSNIVKTWKWTWIIDYSILSLKPEKRSWLLSLLLSENFEEPSQDRNAFHTIIQFQKTHIHLSKFMLLGMPQQIL